MLDYTKLNLEIIFSDSCIDNRPDLCDRLSISVSEQASISSSLLILLIYDRWGKDCVKYIRGDFSFALRDNLTKQIFCARDPLGIKPFYYSFSNEQFFCDSKLDKVLAKSSVSSPFDEPFIASYLLDKFFAHSERTFYKDVKKLPAGHTLLLESNKTKKTRYWFPENVPSIHYRSDDEYAEALMDLYEKVIRDCISSSSDPIGIELSGGLDSSSITILAAQELQKQNRTKPFVYSWEPSPDIKKGAQPHIYTLIQTVCEQAELIPQYVFPSERDVEHFFRRDSTRYPSTSVLIHQLPVQKKAQTQGVSTILSGWGGDHCVTYKGQGYYAELVKKRQWRQLFREARSKSLNPINFVAKQILKPWLYNMSIYRNVNPHLRHQKSHINKLFSKHTNTLPLTTIPLHKSVHEGQIWNLIGAQMTGRLEATAASAAEHGVNYRYPLLDRRLLEFALGLPPEQFLRGKTNRWIARKAFAKILPEEVRTYSDKRDINRTDALRNVLSLTTSRLANSLPTTSSSKMAAYVDINSLRQQLKSAQFRENPKLGEIRNALHLLNSA